MMEETFKSLIQEGDIIKTNEDGKLIFNPFNIENREITLNEVQSILRKYGIKVSTIMPGSVATNFNDHTPSEKDAWKIQPEDIGELVLDLLKMNPRTLPSKIEVRPTMPPSK